MNISTKKRSKKALIIVATVLTLSIVGAAAAYVYAFDGNLLGWTAPDTNKRENGVDYGKPTREQQAGEKDITDRNLESSNNGQNPNGVGSDRPSSPQPQKDSKSTVNVSITAANQNESMYQIRTLIGLITSEGNCTLTLTNGSQKIIKSAKVQSLPSGSTCQGFDIPLTELTKGTWQLTVEFENNSVEGSSERAISVS